MIHFACLVARRYGVGWYRRHFTLAPTQKGSVLRLEFEGTYRAAQVYLNGLFIGQHESGYTSYFLRIDNITAPNATLRYDGTPNVLAVRTDASAPSGWWYDGGGIPRHVWLVTTPQVAIAPWGVFVLPSVVGAVTHGESMKDTAAAQVAIEVHTENLSPATSVASQLLTLIYDETGAMVGNTSIDLVAGKVATITVAINNASLWCAERPVLYTVVNMLTTNSSRDTLRTRIGIRRIVFDNDKGFAVNDRATKLKGFANHQDFAGVGVAVPDNLQMFRITKLKEMGANAWRCAHNPPAPSLLDAADELGFYVWDENHANQKDAQQDVVSLMLRDRNHPSVVLWSLCNEALCSHFDADAGALLKATMKQYDTSRPVTAAMNGDWGDNFSTLLDVVGFNYHPFQEYDQYHSTHPAEKMIGSETSSALSDRGVYTADKVNRMYVSAFDVNKPPWGETVRIQCCTHCLRIH